MTSEPFDYAACQKRLRSVTAEAEIIASFDRMVDGDLAGDSEAFDDPARLARSNDAMSSFLTDTARLNFSLDYIFGGRGEPFLSPGVAA